MAVKKLKWFKVNDRIKNEVDLRIINEKEFAHDVKEGTWIDHMLGRNMCVQ